MGEEAAGGGDSGAGVAEAAEGALPGDGEAVVFRRVTFAGRSSGGGAGSSAGLSSLDADVMPDGGFFATGLAGTSLLVGRTEVVEVGVSVRRMRAPCAHPGSDVQNSIFAEFELSTQSGDGPRKLNSVRLSPWVAAAGGAKS